MASSVNRLTSIFVLLAIYLVNASATPQSAGAEQDKEKPRKAVTLEDQCKAEQKQVDDFNKQCLESQDRICAVIRNKTSSPCVALMKQKSAKQQKRDE